MPKQATLHLFCRVIDNFGDIGVCWRLARQLANEYPYLITLWVDDLNSFHQMCADVDPLIDQQSIYGVNVRRWSDEFSGEWDDQADVLIEAFGCDLPQACSLAMAKRKPPPIWINLEYLSAEQWVEGCHGLSSLHQQSQLIRHFFFPGFTHRTGGLIREHGLTSRRIAFQLDEEAKTSFLYGLGVQPAVLAFKVSLFCYPNAPVSALLQRLQCAGRSVQCFVPEGVATKAVQEFLGMQPLAGARGGRGDLEIVVLPFLNQVDYDKLLWSCDLNFVRGEDSFVRAQWAARPFVWQIYPQQENAHFQKLQAFLDQYLVDADTSLIPSLSGFWHDWNSGIDISAAWDAFNESMPLIAKHAVLWSDH